MDLLRDNDDAKTEASTSAASILTPQSTTITADDPCYSRNYQVPWPGNTYMIIEKGTDRAITLTSTGLYLQDIEKDPDANNHWLCVDSQNYIGFFNTKSRVYMGHDGGNGMLASAEALNDWELMVPRHHPDGGYQLLTPYWSSAMMMVTAQEDGGSVLRTKHGTTLWQFVPV
ncbi:hypothetical protein CDV31_008054 [Fusarium ambrosium]|uniref:Ricin B lectin domain-containing protein n=1 Tax=Fusarium ambrosium TaxID=131363 RepID=A0A428U378_9HYPO|nr:hypothetical protein CDV31_008054 [Fusarium ambrosium]